MRRISHLVLAAFIAVLPTPSLGASKYDAASSSSASKKKKKPKKTKAAEREQQVEAERAQGEDEESQGSKRKKKRRSKTVDVGADGTATETVGDGGETEKSDPPKSDAPKSDATAAAAEKPATATPPAAADDDDDGADLEENPSRWVEALSKSVPPRRYAYVLGAIIGGTGLVFAYQAQGEAKRAETITSALEAQRAVNNARASAALANVLYGLAAAAVLLALVLEFIPEPVAEKAALTFHF